MAVLHWIAPDVVGDILAEALRPDAADAVAIHVRPEIHALIRHQAEETRAPTGGTADTWHGIRLVVDDTIPHTPGFEVHRAVTHAGNGTGHGTGDVVTAA